MSCDTAVYSLQSRHYVPTVQEAYSRADASLSPGRQHRSLPHHISVFSVGTVVYVSPSAHAPKSNGSGQEAALASDQLAPAVELARVLMAVDGRSGRLALPVVRCDVDRAEFVEPHQALRRMFEERVVDPVPFEASDHLFSLSQRVLDPKETGDHERVEIFHVYVRAVQDLEYFLSILHGFRAESPWPDMLSLTQVPIFSGERMLHRFSHLLVNAADPAGNGGCSVERGNLNREVVLFALRKMGLLTAAELLVVLAEAERVFAACGKGLAAAPTGGDSSAGSGFGLSTAALQQVDGVKYMGFFAH